MNITFLIGNGFDLNLGLQTSYQSFYKYYISKAPNDFIAKSISRNYELWSDLEIGLGKFLKTCKEEDIDKFLDSKNLLEAHLTDYLKAQNKRVTIKNEQAIANELQKFVTEFKNDFNSKDKQHYDYIIENAQSISYRFITFNYTDVLDQIITIAKNHLNPFSKHHWKGNIKNDSLYLPLHINGSLDDGLIIGLDNATQIENPDLQNNSSLTDYMIKEKLNEELGEFNIKKAKDIITNSQIICIFGLSIGDTDNYWWKYLMEWLLKSGNNRLVLFVRDDSLVATNAATAKIRYRNQKRQSFITHNSSLSKEQKEIIKDRIIIVKNSNIFSFSEIELVSNKSDLYKNDILKYITESHKASFNDIKENTPFSDRTIRKYLNELINEGKITFTTADHNRKIYAIA